MNRREAGRLGYEAAKDKCAERWRKFRAKYEAKPKKCLRCGAVLPYEKRKCKFCNHSCAAKFNNKSDRSRMKPKVRVCESCGGKFTRTPNTRSDKCIGCRKVYGSAASFEQCGCSRTRKKYFLRTRGHRCEVCKRVNWCGKEIPLDMDHTDGNAENNAESNLRLICPNCHAQTATYKSKNKGNGRHSRRVRYAVGKSY